MGTGRVFKFCVPACPSSAFPHECDFDCRGGDVSFLMLANALAWGYQAPQFRTEQEGCMIMFELHNRRGPVFALRLTVAGLASGNATAH